MTPKDRESLEVFVLRQANLTVLDRVLGEDIFDRVAQDRLLKADRDYLLHLALQEEIETQDALQIGSSPAHTRKLQRFLRNLEAVKRILQS